MNLKRMPSGLTLGQQIEGVRDEFGNIESYQTRTQRKILSDQQNARFQDLQRQADEIRNSVTDFEDYKKKYSALSPELKRFFVPPQDIEIQQEQKKQQDISAVDSRIAELQGRADKIKENQQRYIEQTMGEDVKTRNANIKQYELEINEINSQISSLQQNKSKISEGYTLESVFNYAEQKAQAQRLASENKSTPNYDDFMKANPTEKVIIDANGNVTGIESGRFQKSLSIESYNKAVEQFNQIAKAKISEFQKANPTETLVFDKFGNVTGIESKSFQKSLSLDNYNKAVEQFNKDVKASNNAVKSSIFNPETPFRTISLTEKYYPLILQKKQEFNRAGDYEQIKNMTDQEFFKKYVKPYTIEGGYFPARINKAFRATTEMLGKNTAKVYASITGISEKTLNAPAPDWFPRLSGSDIIKFGLFQPVMETTLSAGLKSGYIEPVTPKVEFTSMIKNPEEETSQVRTLGKIEQGTNKAASAGDYLVKFSETGEAIGKGNEAIMRKIGPGTMRATQSNVFSVANEGGTAQAENIINSGGLSDVNILQKNAGRGIVSQTLSKDIKEITDAKFVGNQNFMRKINAIDNAKQIRQTTVGVLKQIDEEGNLYLYKGSTQAEIIKTIDKKSATFSNIQMEKEISNINEIVKEAGKSEAERYLIKKSESVSVLETAIRKAVKENKPVMIEVNMVEETKAILENPEITGIVKLMKNNAKETSKIIEGNGFKVEQTGSPEVLSDAQLNKMVNKMAAPKEIPKQSQAVKGVILPDFQAKTSAIMNKVIGKIENIGKAKIVTSGPAMSSSFMTSAKSYTKEIGKVINKIMTAQQSSTKLQNKMAQESKQIQEIKQESKFQSPQASANALESKLKSMLYVTTALKLETAQKFQQVSVEESNLAKAGFKVPNINIKPDGTIIFGGLTSAIKNKKKKRIKTIQFDESAYFPDFTSKALGFKPESVAMKDINKVLNKINTGLEIRKGVKIKW